MQALAQSGNGFNITCQNIILDSDTLTEGRSNSQSHYLTQPLQPTSDSDYDHILSQLHHALTKTKRKLNSAEVELLNKSDGQLGRKESTGRSQTTIRFKNEALSTKYSVSTQTISTSEIDEELSSNGNFPMQDVHSELVAINEHLKRQSQALLDRQYELDKRESALAEMEDTFRAATSTSLRQLVESEIEDRWYKLKQIDTLTEQNKRYQTQISTLNRRFKNLQQKHAFTLKKASTALHVEKATTDSLKKPLIGTAVKPHQQSTLSKESLGIYDLLSIILEWIVDVHLGHIVDDLEQQGIKKGSPSLPAAFLNERCAKVLPFLAEILPLLPSGHLKIQQPCLQFIYWSVIHLDMAGSQRVILASTYRRIGEELFKPTMSRPIGEATVNASNLSSSIHYPEKNKCNLYLHSTNLRIRILSALIILKIMNQADRLASVLEILHKDLMTDMGKEILLQCKGIAVVTIYLKASNKVLLERVVDLMLLMSMESPLLDDFLNSCSNESWFRACSAVIRSPSTNSLVIEKLSIILQRLSKMK
ncbi:uncharacterized protein TRIADDRAFT_60981 [Trichoplax adhaerens]|uniref:Coiled-coil domain-containing protein n=1 Tax=Trichoplax adhaerens TaxID=10228 RepID=B3S9P5_TRIAD|nr:hypothetical protein TRIADDRAFT_60981 [Trichoplax adhaerens]EDV20573.1 hypothetical protein TRIADDRAFT_60981 [Trichoplax adhaerens]|eukprot:XP_002116999.1 hypothetical protein TRIADDRAFT_60981 [Trichoplax adhaerens]